MNIAFNSVLFLKGFRLKCILLIETLKILYSLKSKPKIFLYLPIIVFYNPIFKNKENKFAICCNVNIKNHMKLLVAVVFIRF